MSGRRRQRRNIRTDQPRLAIANDGISLLQIGTPVAEAFDFPTLECESCFKLLLYEVVMTRLAIFDDRAIGTVIVVASISLAQGPLRLEFMTKNQLTPYTSISMTLSEGPFRDLRGQWDFTPLGHSGSKVSLNLQFAFENRVMDVLLGPPFEALCNRLVDTFVRRARAIHS